MLNAALQKLIRYDQAAAKKLQAHAGKQVKVQLELINLAVVIAIQEDTLTVHTDTDTEVNTTISGKPSALFAMGTNQHIAGLDTVTINGDAAAGQFVADFLKQLRPDWEEVWCDLLGDGPGYQVSQFLHSAFNMGSQWLQSIKQSSQEYLLEENRELISPHEMEAFLDQVDDLRADVVRLERKLAALKS
nr:SCP2 sterol-binding domain-containing protein [Marinicella sp. NBU2979]